ncbi:DDT domain-containing protein PTM [Iris pallida]|uniref:DDT domain-containing protein PTM n=1 Tax=Iris pallida TaxID=29817 RepID=A0AAX6EYA4_IRIPA|nr:DDT domain-containing protein PTM [Iris pallida]
MVTEDASEEADSSTNSCDDDVQTGGPQTTSSPLRGNTIVVVSLPPSSRDLDVPEESVSYLFSVYNFLRSFSLQLYLSPFGLHELVGCLNCTVQNSLLDAVHLSLMRVLRRHLQSLSFDGSEIASKCLRHCDWSLLDALTWPAILLEYLFIMGYAKGLTEKGFKFGVSAGEYYGLSVALKLEAMQILCDDVVDSEELRTELDTRVDKMEEGGEYEASDSIFQETENVPGRVHPRYSKTSACKNLEALENSVESKPVNPESKVLEMVDASSDCQDGNSDECWLCGMNGSLVCCDGCPSAYHVRCIGLYKSFLPDGLWFCPECTVNKLGKPSSRIGRGASGAEIFGMDANGRVFLGTCNYLLVVGASSNSEPICRYYNQGDVSKVLTMLYLTAENASIYTDICRGISRYWEIPLVSMQSGKPEPTKDPWVDMEPVVARISSSTTLPEGTANPLYGAEVDKLMTTNLTEGTSGNRAVVSQKDCSTEAMGKHSSLVLLDKVDFPDSEKHVTASLDVCTNEMSEAADKTLCPVKERKFISGLSRLTAQKVYPGTHTMIHGHMGNDFVVTDNLSYSNQPISAESSIILDAATCELGNKNGIWEEDEHISTFSKMMEPVAISSESRIWCHQNDETFRIKSQTISSSKSTFKPQAYINLYVQGAIAATAAAILAVQASEESKVSEARVASNPRKAMAEKFTLETKAFSMATSEFLWPCFEKYEAPRAKCGWCSACSVTYRKGCLLNLAANKSSKRFVRNASVLRPNKPIDSHIPTIAAQIAHMEESLQGLIDSPLSDVAYSKQWRKLIGEASGCRELNFLLLELEKSIRGITFSAEWSKLVDDSVDFSSSLGAVRRSVPGQKHGPGRRCNKQYVASEAENDTSSGSSKTQQWWRGGRLSKIVFQKRALSNSLVKKAGRQGGSKRIPGIHYPEVSGLPRRSRQLAWRASVQMSKNLSQLALQVRYLDAHIRWRDLVRPEENPLDGKGSEVDATAFRNAVICDKRITENRISYALNFAIQKHLPLRVTKNILETETTQDGNGKLWFSEYHVPLYLIKEYEAKAGMKPLTCPPINCREMLRSRGLPKLEIRQLKGQDDIFSYLIRKRDAVRCSTCQVYYQKDCTITSPAAKEGDLELFTCTKCYRMKFASLVGSSKQNSNTQQHLQAKNQQQLLKGQNQQQFFNGQNQQQFLKRPNQNQCIQRQNQLVTGTKLIPKVGQNISAQQVGQKEVQSEIRCSASGSKSQRKRNISSSEYGLIWKRIKLMALGRRISG